MMKPVVLLTPRCLLLTLVLSLPVLGGTTGKISGRVQDAETGEGVVGASIVLEGTSVGASTDVDGNYVIINIPPGSYTVSASGVGYQRKRFLNVKVNVDFTTRLDVKLTSEAIAMETVEVQAEAPMIRRDLTSTHTTVDAAAIQALPVESVTQLLTLQAGIVQGADGSLHIRGGRSNEIQYTVNGVSISNPFDNSRSVQIATNAIQELSVVSGTFNAEYGNALSGVVNTVTKEGGRTLSGSVSGYAGDYISTHDDVFTNIRKVNPLSHTVLEATLSGPVPELEEYANFFLSARKDQELGWLYGIRESNPWDYVYRNPTDPNDIRLLQTGDKSLVSMNPSNEFSGTAKLTVTPFSAAKIRYDVVYSNSDYKNYTHDYKYNPDASYNNMEWGMFHSLELRHAVNASTYYTVRGSYTLNDYKQYLYPLLDASNNEVNYSAGCGIDISTLHASPAYQPDYKSVEPAPYTFLAGGTQNGHYYQRSRTFGVKFDVTSQLDKSHEVKLGVEYKDHKLDFENFTVLCDTVRYFSPTIPGTNTSYHDVYSRVPKEVSAYIQDKMEFDNLILNVGLRYDYFSAKSAYSTEMFYPSPNSPTLPTTVDKASLLADAAGKHQWSPRVGVSFPITDKGIIHFSYGHFFQMPPFSYLYTNPGFKYSFSSGTPTFGNANLNPQKTVTYELGLQQQLMENLSFTVTGFYKDVRDLLALQQIRISGDETYYKYVNKDYSNVKGITFSLTKRRTAGDLVGATLDYTYQVAEGNDVDANAFFLDLSSGRQTEKIPVYLSWDQSHTLNATVTVGQPSDWNITLVGRVGTGLPYTPQITSKTVYLTPNSGRKPSHATVDLLADKTFVISGISVTAFVKVFNLFDALDERYVYDDTGRATYTLVATQGTAQATDKLSGTISGLHSAQEYFVRPSYYAPPRQVRVGATVEF
jgi:outer membrane receptor protein involved in Fe transport